jgi:DNA-binding transcriptional ArsR family regulator
MSPVKEKKERIEDDMFHDLAGFFRILGDFTRLRILNLLSERERNVSEIAESLNMEQSAISHQLRILRQARLVRFSREGKSIIYSLDDDHVSQVFLQGLEHVRE